MLARRYRLAAAERRRLLADAAGKRTVLERLTPSIAAARRTIVFTQSIAASEETVRRLGHRGLRAGVVHSGLAPDQRRRALDLFACGEVPVMSAPASSTKGSPSPTPTSPSSSGPAGPAAR